MRSLVRRVKSVRGDRTRPEAIVRKLEVIGEAVKHYSDGTSRCQPAIPWRQTAGMLDHLTDAYVDVDLALVSQTAQQGNSVFVDDDLVPWPDQWAFLAGVQRIGRINVEAIVQEAERRGRVLGVRLPGNRGNVGPSVRSHLTASSSFCARV